MGVAVEDIKKRKERYLEKRLKFIEELSCYDTSNATLSDPLKKSSLFELGGKGGVPLASEFNTAYMDPRDSHTVTIGSTGSKKTRLVALPAVHLLGAAGESMIISDPKGEIFEHSSGYLEQRGYFIDVVDFRSPKRGSGWNPLSLPFNFYISGNKDRCYELTYDITINFINMDKSGSDPFWDNSAGSLFQGLALLLFEICKKFKLPANMASMSNVFNLRLWMLGDKASRSFSTPERQRANVLWDIAKNCPDVMACLACANSEAEQTNAGILSVFDSKMFFLKISPSLNDMLSEGKSRIEDIRKKPGVVYLIYPDEKTALHKLVSLFVKQSYEQLIYLAQNDVASDAVRVNYILDEFSSLPAISDFPAMITAGRSRGIRFNLLIQSRHQLKLRYSEETETIMSNCDNWIFLNGREVEFLKDISALCGEYEREGVRRSVLSLTDLQRLEKESGDALVLQGRLKPYLTNLKDIGEYNFGELPAAKVPSRGESENTENGLEKMLADMTDERMQN